jgi:hypothetical protein
MLKLIIIVPYILIALLFIPYDRPRLRTHRQSHYPNKHKYAHPPLYWLDCILGSFAKISFIVYIMFAQYTTTHPRPTVGGFNRNR